MNLTNGYGILTIISPKEVLIDEEKGFHCVEFKHEAQMQIYKEIKNMTPEQEIEYFRRRAETGVFGKLWGKLHGESAAEGKQNITISSLPHHPHHP